MQSNRVPRYSVVMPLKADASDRGIQPNSFARDRQQDSPFAMDPGSRAGVTAIRRTSTDAVFTNPVIPEAAQRLSGISVMCRDMNTGFLAAVAVRRHGSA